MSIGYPPSSHPAVRLAAERLAAALSLPAGPADAPAGCRLFLAAGADAGTVPAARSFRIAEREGVLCFFGDRPRSVLAAAEYWLGRRERGQPLEIPVERRSPFAERLIMEDFPFMCYQPTGFDFDLERYASNLAALGFTAMECNRFSSAQPMGPRHWNYAFTNPSPADFVWTSRHEGLFERATVEANARELDRTMEAARRCDLDPTLTSFLPRPYPERFFQARPTWRGPAFLNRYMQESGHEPAHALDTDHPEVQAFYREVYALLFDRYPDIGHLFFWHADLGTQFWPDGKGPGQRRRVDRVAGFHRMLGALLEERGMRARVWLNPWGLAADCLDDLNAVLPPHVGFSIKDNPGYATFAGSTPVTLGDATVITAALGAVPEKVMALAREKGRAVCLGQYQDFSEDLDPVLAVPHPIMTFRKFRTLQRLEGLGASAAHWGVLSPDIAPVNPNQDVIREMQWGHPARVFGDLLEDLLPAAFTAPEPRALAYKAWRRVDDALRLWPQFWGLRLQDSGVRLRWLVRPFGFGLETLDPSEKSYYLDRQIYALDPPDPFGAFMEIDAAQGREIADLYGDMTALLEESLTLLHRLEDSAASGGGRSWARRQAAALTTLHCFWETYRRLFAFYGHREKALAGDAEARTLCGRWVAEEEAHVKRTRAHLAAHPETLVIARGGGWGQCFGPDLDQDLARKATLMKAAGNAPGAECP